MWTLLQGTHLNSMDFDHLTKMVNSGNGGNGRNRGYGRNGYSRFGHLFVIPKEVIFALYNQTAAGWLRASKG